MKKILFILLLLTSNAQSAEIFGVDVSVWAGGEHITHDQDAIQLGVSLEWDHIDVNLSAGMKRTKWRVVDEPSWEMDEWQSGSIVSISWYPFNTTSIRPMLLWSHSSDITRGRPFNNKKEPTSDFLGIGVTFQKKKLEIDLAIGRSAKECDLLKCHKGSLTTEVMIRFRGYIWGK